MTELDRRAVIALVHSIKVTGKNKLQITFRYQVEYEQTLKKLAKNDQFASLLVMLPTLAAQAKEAI